MTPAKPADLVARVGFSVPNLDGADPPETTFEQGDTVPPKALTEKNLAALLKQGIVVRADDEDPPELGWRETHRVVNGVVIDPDPEDAPAEDVPA